MEKPLAQAAGIGWQGKHTNLVQPRAWQLAVPRRDPDQPRARAGRAGRSTGSIAGRCPRCLDACPTAGVRRRRTGSMRARCISYLTIEHDGPIPDEFRAAIGNRIYGCDDCLAVCPWNRFADAAAANRAFLPRAELAAPRLADLLALDDAAFREMFAGSPIKRIGRNRMIRNCLIAAGNSGDPRGWQRRFGRIWAIPTRSSPRRRAGRWLSCGFRARRRRPPDRCRRRTAGAHRRAYTRSTPPPGGV